MYILLRYLLLALEKGSQARGLLSAIMQEGFNMVPRMKTVHLVRHGAGGSGEAHFKCIHCSYLVQSLDSTKVVNKGMLLLSSLGLNPHTFLAFGKQTII